MQKNQVAAAVAEEVRLKPARLDISAPWELPDAYKAVIGESIAGDAWLERLGLQGLLTGVANSDLRVYRSSVERLAGMLRYARQQGREEGERGFESDCRWIPRPVYIARAWLAGGIGFFLGGALIGLIATFF